MFQLEILLAGFCVSVLGFAVWAIWLLTSLSRATQRVTKLQQLNLRSLEGFDLRFQQILDACRAQPAKLSESVAYLKTAADDIRWQATNKDIVLSDQLDMLVRQYRALVALHCESRPAAGQQTSDANAQQHLAVAAEAEEHLPENRSRAGPLRRLEMSPRPIRRSPPDAGQVREPAKGELITLRDHFSRQAPRPGPARQFGETR